MISVASLLAATAGALATVVTWELIGAIERPLLLGGMARLIAPARAAGLDGRAPATIERRRLAVLAGLGVALAGWSLLGPLAALLLAACGPILATALIRLRQRRWRASLARDAAPAARAIGDALSAGQPVVVAIARAGQDGAVGSQTRSALAELAAATELGLPADQALETLRRRAGPGPWEAIVSAIQLQRRAGGDLALLLRELAGDLELTRRARSEARAASAQARLTARIVMMMPLASAALAVLVAPGAIGKMLSMTMPRALLLAAAAMQLVALLAVRRVAKVRQ